MSEKKTRENEKETLLFTDILNRKFPWASDEPEDTEIKGRRHRAASERKHGPETDQEAEIREAVAVETAAPEEQPQAPDEELMSMFSEDRDAFTEAGPEPGNEAMKTFFSTDTDSDNGPALRSKKKKSEGKVGRKGLRTSKKAAENLESMEKSGLHIFRAFLMGLGNFTVIPVGRDKWDDSLKDMMLATLPAIGAIIGTLWVLFGTLLMKITTPIILYAFLMVGFIFCITGFIHVDGFMDCADAIMSRRDLEERRRILKDPRVGAFAVIAMVFLALGNEAAMESFLAGNPKPSDLIPLIIIPIISRAVAGGCVMFFPALPTSQYARPEMHEEADYETLKKARRLKRGEFTAIIMQVLIFFELLILIGTALGGKTNFMAVLIAALSTLFTTLIVILAARFNLRGMNGDIAGLGICIGELVGLIVISYI
ncbi:MAG: adenosylcobinamide-GDP ribazoletransferase [Eubacterium sp.]|nr:adenosylcobinamide-GDP ribazoletransferase [Eubacterium sp.]